MGTQNFTCCHTLVTTDTAIIRNSSFHRSPRKTRAHSAPLLRALNEERVRVPGRWFLPTVMSSNAGLFKAYGALLLSALVRTCWSCDLLLPSADVSPTRSHRHRFSLVFDGQCLALEAPKRL